jgi:hypothetical protein
LEGFHSEAIIIYIITDSQTIKNEAIISDQLLIPGFLLFYQLTLSHQGLRVGVFFFAGGQFFFPDRSSVLMVASFHFPAEKTAVGVDGTLNRHSEVVSLFLHGVSPVDSEFSDSRFIYKNSSAEKVGDKLGGSV